MIASVGSVEAATIAEVEAIVAAHKTLEDVTRWALAARPPKRIERIVVQDEYTHDVVIRHAGGVYLVYDTT